MTTEPAGCDETDPENSPDSTSPPAPTFPTFGALFGLDYGTKRIGVAICNETQSIACPLENYDRRNDQLDSAWLIQLVRGYQIAGLVVGLPVHMSGDEGGKAKEAREFGEWAAVVTGLPLKFCDERYSSTIADMHLNNYSRKKKKARRDQVAAQVFLQRFLDSDNRDAKPISLQW
jgi:putative holliday junction resolvase